MHGKWQTNAVIPPSFRSWLKCQNMRYLRIPRWMVIDKPDCPREKKLGVDGEMRGGEVALVFESDHFKNWSCKISTSKEHPIHVKVKQGSLPARQRQSYRIGNWSHAMNLCIRGQHEISNKIKGMLKELNELHGFLYEFCGKTECEYIVTPKLVLDAWLYFAQPLQKVILHSISLLQPFLVSYCKYFCKTFSVNTIFPNFLTRTAYTFMCISLYFMNKSLEPSKNGQMFGFRCTTVHIDAHTYIHTNMDTIFSYPHNLIQTFWNISNNLYVHLRQNLHTIIKTSTCPYGYDPQCVNLHFSVYEPWPKHRACRLQARTTCNALRLESIPTQLMILQRL